VAGHRLVFVLVGPIVAVLALAGPAAGQTSQPSASPAPPASRPAEAPPAADQPAPAAPQKPIIPPRELDRIKRALSQTPGFVLDEEGFRFYVEIVAKRPTFAEYAKGYDFINGPTRRGNPMTHQEYLKMVTPRDFYSSAGIKPTEMLQMAVTNWLGQTLIKQAIEDMLRARSERERDEIRARIDRELAALTAGQDKAQ
jgi:hypothetical protein